MELDKTSPVPLSKPNAKRKGLIRLLRMKRFWAGLLLAALLALGIRVIFSFSQMEAEVSNSLSKEVTSQIQAWTDKFFSINPNDSFWQHDLNNIVRKVGHVIEYFLLGLLVCSFFQVITRRQWLTLPLSLLACFGIAMFDERLQYFAEGRGPRMSDVWLDTGAAAIGILLMGVVLTLIQRYISMNRTIKEYERMLGEQEHQDENRQSAAPSDCRMHQS